MAVQIVRANAQDDLPTEWTLVGWSDVVHECGCDWVDEPNRQARSMTEVAAEDNEVDVVFGGGRNHLLPQGRGGVRPDGEDLRQVLRDRGSRRWRK